jgi:hypothetical protein
MSKLVNKLIKPESILIEKTALEMAAVYYEAGRATGFTSKYKDPRSFAHANVEKFIPMAVELLMEMLTKDSTPKEQKDAIYDAFMERTNDQELSNIGIDAFKNDNPFTSDKVVEPKPVIWNTEKIEDILNTNPPLQGASNEIRKARN